ncbi:hypothetical protein [Vibrio fluvialis]|uniref:hypothetical protein n=1 Tax=Vibrio fluvialis TaxID=676 RepID=UPI001F33DB07|nr:hypothetical protein [Vibrio fluvialis]MCE7642031.1 hypothetical protein [Vibrio fluvialis]
MTITTKQAALQALTRIRQHQRTAAKSFSPLTKAAEAEKAVEEAVNIIEYLITSGDATETALWQEKPSAQ